MNPSTSLGRDGAADPVLDDLVAEITDKLQAGAAVDVEAYAAAHPELAEELRRLMPALQMLAAAGSPPESDAVSDGEEGEAPLGEALGDFRIVREIGRGGMGVVYEAEQVSLRRRVALKVLPLAATLDPRHLQRFHNEAQAAASLQHAHIVPVYAIGCEGGIHFYAMQMIEGLPLTTIISQQRQQQESKQQPAAGQKSSGTAEVSMASTSPGADSQAADASSQEVTTAYTPPSLPRMPSALLDGKAESISSVVPSESERDYYRWVAEVGVQAAEALDHAHQMGVVHRDVKPANLLLDGKGHVWVTDFGLAQVRQQEGSLTQTGDIIGTIRYMSPEQALAQRDVLDQRSDVYSLAATLYELLVLQPGFASTDRQELLRQVVNDEPPRPRAVRRGIPVDLETIVLKAMEKRPQDRYATAQEMADDLQRWLNDEPIRARRPNLAARLGRWMRRHRPAVAAGLVVLLMALVLAGWAGWSRHDRALERAAREQVVRAALDDTRFWQEQGRLPEALSAARRAAGMLAGGEVGAELRQLAQARLADLELLDRLESVRLEAAAAVKDGHWDGEGADALYRRRFQEVGLDVEALSAEEAGQRIGRSTVAVELAAVLDDWALTRNNITGPADPSWKHFLHVARRADPDGTRTRMRLALEQGDRQVRRRLVASEEALHLPPSTQHVLGQALIGDRESHGPLERFLRAAQRQTPNDFWLNEILFDFCSATKPPQWEEAVRFAASAVAIRPESAGARFNLGLALKNKGQLDEAIAEYRKAIHINKECANAHFNLGLALKDKGQLDDAIGEWRKAIEINKDHVEAYVALGIALQAKGQLDGAIAAYRNAIQIKEDYAQPHNNLGVALKAKGQLDDAIGEWHKAIRINKDYANAHNNLGLALQDKGRIDEAIDEYRTAINIDKDYYEPHNNFGNALKAKGRIDEAIGEYRTAIRINKDYAVAHYNLGNALKARGQINNAIAAYRTAIRINKDYAEPHCNLGEALQQQGQFAEALTYLRRGHQLGSRRPGWPYPSAQWVRHCERLLDLDYKLSAILGGQKQPDNAEERLALVQLCLVKHLCAAAVRFYREAFADRPQLADDLKAQHRFNAACAAALAGCGQGKDANSLDEKQRARLRQQALDWLRDDLKAYRQVMEKAAARAGPAILERMQHWLQDNDLVGVRGEKALARLPEAECKDWRKLWKEAEALRQRAAQQPKTASSTRP